MTYPYPIGIDTSHWKDDPSTPWLPDMKKARDKGCTFNGIKVSQDTFTDRLFKHFWVESKKYNILRLPFHFYDYSSSKHHVTEQAKYFTDQMDELSEMPPVMDVETYNPWGNLPAREKLLSEIWQFFEITDKWWGGKSMLYTNYATIKYRLQPVPQWLLEHPIWIAYPAAILPEYIYAPWDKWTIWQYTFNGDGLAYGMESKSVDLNYFNGTYEEMWEWCIKPGDEPPTPEPTDAEKLAILWDEYKKTH